MSVLTYTIVNFLLFSSWYYLLYANKKDLSFIDRLTGAFILCLAQVIFTEFLLGILFKKLFAIPLFFSNVIISLTVFILAVVSSKYDKNNNNFAGGVLSEFIEQTAGIINVIRKDVILFSVFSLFFISVCWIIFLGYLFPSYTWDALWYHLPIVGYIVQSGVIQENPTPSMIDLFINIFPKNIELFFVWNTIFLKDDAIIDLSQLPFTIAGVFTIYSMAVKLGLKEKHALYSSFLFFFTPIIILQSSTNYIDVAVSVLFLIAINFLMYENPGNNARVTGSGGRRILILLSGLTTGILLGSKGSGPLFAIVLLVITAARGFIRNLRPFNLVSLNLIRDRIITYLIYFLIPVSLTGGYWYIKNWVLYDNPVYPMEVSIFSYTLFKGIYKEIIESVPASIVGLSPLSKVFYVWRERLGYYMYDSRLGGVGPLWFILFLPSLVFSAIRSIKEKKYDFIFVFTILIVTFMIYPRNWTPRYGIFIAGLGALSFGYVLEYFEERQTSLKIIALILVLYVFFTSNSPCITPSKIKEFLNLPAKERTIARHAPFNIDIHARQEYGHWIWISNNISEGDVLAYTFEPLFLSPLWNKDFSNKIVYVKSKNFNGWLKSLKDNHATYILIRQDSPEDRWIKILKKFGSPLLPDAANQFKIVYSDENYKVARFKY